MSLLAIGLHPPAVPPLDTLQGHQQLRRDSDEWEKTSAGGQC